MELKRCAWAKTPESIAYHDAEWCVPEHDDRMLFELLILEGKQAGLSWDLILRRRAGMRDALDGFDPVRIAAYDDAKLEALRGDARLIRNRRKLEALRGNARAFLAVQREFGSFDRFLWSFVQGGPIVNAWRDSADAPAQSAASEALSAALTKRGFRFVGPTICYSYMQAAGLIDDHEVSCPWHTANRARGALREVAAALICKDGKFLICRRPPEKARGGLWEFVGGKTEAGETGRAALVRECREELDVTVAAGEEYMQLVHVYPDIAIRLTLYCAAIVQGEPKLLEHTELRWITPAEIDGFAFCPADEEILARIKAQGLPRNAI